MVISQVRPHAESSPIRPGATEALWGFVGTVATVIVVLAVAIFILRWTGFRFGYQLGRLKRH